jgi:hypothetical protein
MHLTPEITLEASTYATENGQARKFQTLTLLTINSSTKRRSGTF